MSDITQLWSMPCTWNTWRSEIGNFNQEILTPNFSVTQNLSGNVVVEFCDETN